MNETLELSAEEREYLVTHLKSVLNETRVEVDSTDSRHYRELVKQREELIRGLLEKLERSPALSCPAGTILLG